MMASARPSATTARDSSALFSSYRTFNGLPIESAVRSISLRRSWSRSGATSGRCAMSLKRTDFPLPGRSFGRPEQLERFLEQRARLEARQLERRGKQRHVDLARFDERTCLARHSGGESQPHVGRTALEDAIERSSEHRGHRASDAEAHRPARLAPCVSDVVLQAVHLAQDRGGAFQQALTFHGQLHAAGVSLEESHSKLLLHLRDVMAECGLRDAERARGGGDAPRARDLHEVPELAVRDPHQNPTSTMGGCQVTKTVVSPMTGAAKATAETAAIAHAEVAGPVR
jgi:hypothetical protein